jgi:hypothetical protein
MVKGLDHDPVQIKKERIRPVGLSVFFDRPMVFADVPQDGHHVQVAPGIERFDGLLFLLEDSAGEVQVGEDGNMNIVLLDLGGSGRNEEERRKTEKYAGQNAHPFLPHGPPLQIRIVTPSRYRDVTRSFRRGPVCSRELRLDQRG